MAGGRPTKYKPEYCQKLIDFMGTGMPYDTFAAEIEVSKDVLYDWEKKYPEFLHAKKVARAKQYKTLVKLGMAGMVGQVQTTAETTTSVRKDDDGNTIEKLIKKKMVNGFNSTAWIFFMKNCCGWKDQIHITEDDLVDELEFDGV